jgi:RimJ/RimL family protein N-acetyltransferase
MSCLPPGTERLPYEAVAGRAERSPRGDSAGDNLLQIWLRPLELDEAVALLAGAGRPAAGLRWHEEYPMTETLTGLGMVVAAHRATGEPSSATPGWWLHQIVLADLVVGDVGFHGPPPVAGPVEVEIGYNVVEGLRGRGIATRACGLILEQAWRDGAAVVRAEVDPGNVASRRVLLRSGFVEHGRDEQGDGDEQGRPDKQDRRYELRRPTGTGVR